MSTEMFLEIVTGTALLGVFLICTIGLLAWRKNDHDDI